MFKRIIFLVFISLFMLNGCGNSKEKHVYIDAVILEVDEHRRFLVETSKKIEGKIIKSKLIFSLEEEQFVKDKYQVGDEIIIDYDGGVSESSPGILDVVYGVELKEINQIQQNTNEKAP